MTNQQLFDVYYKAIHEGNQRKTVFQQKRLTLVEQTYLDVYLDAKVVQTVENVSIKVATPFGWGF
jgi:hypothetical protein